MQKTLTTTSCERPSELLARLAPGAGLAPSIEPLPKGDGLRERFTANPFLMAPMAGVTDGAYRLMARSGGAALAYTEMVSVAGIHYGGDKTWDLVYPADGEPDLAVQLFGSKPDQFREAAAAVQERLGDRLALIDINMACPVRKVVSKGEGSALLEEPQKAADIVRACLAETTVPVTCKIRRSRYEGPEIAPDFARRMEQAGASAIAIHGRTAAQLYHGKADWSAIGRVVDAVQVPVIASGDIMSAQAAVDVLGQTGAAAVMVARGSYGNPWIFGEARDLLAGKEPNTPSIEERLNAVELQLRLLAATGAHLVRGRSIVGWYLKGLPHASAWRNTAMTCVTLDDFLAMLDEARARLEQEDQLG